MKYLINDELRDRLLTILTVTERWNTRNQISELKPIEPLSDWNIDEIYERIDDYEAPTWMHSFARAIEAHILGEKHEDS